VSGEDASENIPKNDKSSLDIRPLDPLLE